MEAVKRLLRRRDSAELEKRVAALEAEVQECRQLNLRLAELCDVMMELLLPVADRDEATVQRVLTQYKNDVGDPARWRP